ncbi:MAG: hypothetical protein EP147_00390 [Subdoligranulum sp.]|nr:hypothetical protein [Subdoligranulum sp.]
MLMTGALQLGGGLLSVSSAQTISAYPELYATTPAWTAWADVITPVLAGAWLLVYGWRALTGFGVRRQKWAAHCGPGAAAGFFMAAGVAVPVCACLAGAHPLHAAGTQCCGGAAVCGGAA